MWNAECGIEGQVLFATTSPCYSAFRIPNSALSSPFRIPHSALGFNRASLRPHPLLRPPLLVLRLLHRGTAADPGAGGCRRCLRGTRPPRLGAPPATPTTELRP